MYTESDKHTQYHHYIYKYVHIYIQTHTGYITLTKFLNNCFLTTVERNTQVSISPLADFTMAHGFTTAVNSPTHKQGCPP